MKKQKEKYERNEEEKNKEKRRYANRREANRREEKRREEKKKRSEGEEEEEARIKPRTREQKQKTKQSKAAGVHVRDVLFGPAWGRAARQSRCNRQHSAGQCSRHLDSRARQSGPPQKRQKTMKHQRET